MSGAGAAGGAIGGVGGQWLGGILGGAVGELFGPEAVVPGAMLGRRLGGYTGQLAGSALAEWLAKHMNHANEKADEGSKAGSDAKVVCPTCAGTRSKPGQTCDDDRLKELEAAKDQAQSSLFTNPAFKSGNAKKLSAVSCADVRRRLEGLRKLRDARQRIQDECFAGATDEGHKQAVEDLDKGIRGMEELESRQCPPDGPPVS